MPFCAPPLQFTKYYRDWDLGILISSLTWNQEKLDDSILISEIPYAHLFFLFMSLFIDGKNSSNIYSKGQGGCLGQHGVMYDAIDPQVHHSHELLTICPRQWTTIDCKQINISSSSSFSVYKRDT